ncbi:MAG: 3-dehydroquinate synthase [Myxococcales bacterium]|nr:3-dehydroquinate synthase [Myxococcales bacterium]
MLIHSTPLTLGYTVEIASDFSGLAAALDALGLKRAVIVTNPTVRTLHGAALAEELLTLAPAWIELPDGEVHKNLDSWRVLVSELLARRVDRQTAVIAFGGGVIGDLAGFAAATVLRGLPLVQVPTTLLAAVDASVGGKTGVNTTEGKNLVGAFHQPKLVWTALHTLRTLPQRETRCGLGELLKHAALDGPGALALVPAGAAALAGDDDRGAAEVVARSVAVKARIVERDPFEVGDRALLNLGHTLGHAIEVAGGYGAISHGEAVCIGMIAAARLGGELAGTTSAFVRELECTAAALGLATQLPPGLRAAELVRAMGFDKKRERGMVRLVIPVAAGDVRLMVVSDSALIRLAELGRVSS